MATICILSVDVKILLKLVFAIHTIPINLKDFIKPNVFHIFMLIFTFNSIGWKFQPIEINFLV